MKYEVTPVTAYQQNCSLVICENTGHAALIDPGGETERLLKNVAAKEIQLEKILLTHGHLDHVGAAAEIAAQLKIPIIGPHKEDAFWLNALPQQAEMFGFASLSAFQPDQWLQDNDSVSVGDLTFEVIHCPGHTPGHVIFYHENSKTAFVGDVLFKGSIGRTDFPKGDHDTLIHCIKNKLLPLGDDVTFVPGHGPQSTLGEERLHNPFIKE